MLLIATAYIMNMADELQFPIIFHLTKSHSHKPLNSTLTTF